MRDLLVTRHASPVTRWSVRGASVALDHSDDLSHEQVFDIFLSELRARGIAFKTPSDPLHDPEFIQFLTSVFEPGPPTIMPAIYDLAAA